MFKIKIYSEVVLRQVGTADDIDKDAGQHFVEPSFDFYMFSTDWLEQHLVQCYNATRS